MNIGRAVPLCIVAVYALWAVVTILGAAAWITMAVGHHFTAQMLGFTTCTISATATAGTVRVYSLRAYDLMRTLHGLEQPSAEVHALR